VAEGTCALASFVEELAEKNLCLHVLRFNLKSGLESRHRLVQLSLLALQQSEAEEHPGEAPLLHIIERHDHGNCPLVIADRLVLLPKTRAALRFEQQDRHGCRREAMSRKQRFRVANHRFELLAVEEPCDVIDILANRVARAPATVLGPDRAAITIRTRPRPRSGRLTAQPLNMSPSIGIDADTTIPWL